MRLVVIALLATTGMQAAASMAQLAVPVLAVEMAPDLGLAAENVGYYSAAVNLSAMVLQLVTGALVIRLGGIRMAQIGLLLAALGLMLTTPALVPLVLLAAVSTGFGYGPATPAGSHILARVSPEHLRNLIFSIKQAGVPLGGVAAGALLAPVAEIWGWRWAMTLGAALCLAIALLAQPARRALDTDRNPNHPIRLRAAGEAMVFALSQPQLRAMSITAFVFAAMQLSLWSFLVVILVERVGFSLVDAGIAFSALQVAGVVARVFWGWVADRFIAARPLTAGIGFAMTGLVIVTAQMEAGWPFWAVLLLAVALGATASGWNGVFLAEVARLAPPGRVGTATGGVIFFTYGGVFVGPFSFGALAGATGDFAASFYASAAIVAVTSLYMLTRK